MKENKLVNLSMDFAVEVLEMTDGIKGRYSLVNQIERSATSIGANIREWLINELDYLGFNMRYRG